MSVPGLCFFRFFSAIRFYAFPDVRPVLEASFFVSLKVHGFPGAVFDSRPFTHVIYLGFIII